MKVVILGTGNVAFHFARELFSTEHEVIQIYGRTLSKAKAIAKKLSCNFTSDIAEIKTDADIYIIALTDEILSETVNQLSFIPSLIVHTSGTLPLSSFPERFKNTGVIYPVQSIKRNTESQFKDITFCIEGSNKSSEIKIRELMRNISRAVLKFNLDKRQLIHLAAVFASNFTNHLFAISNTILKRNGISRDILNPLIVETSVRALHGKSGTFQTGPAVRGDVKVMDHHLNLLTDNPKLKEIYKLLSESIQEFENKLSK